MTLLILLICLTVESALATRIHSDNLQINPSSLEVEDWHLLGPREGVEGIRSEEAIQAFGAPRSEDIVVAVIDGGVDINHEDLQGKIWTNQREIPNNGIDDDDNGYVDDYLGWNFAGNPSGMGKIEKDSSILNGFRFVKGLVSGQVVIDNSELTREVIRLKELKASLERAGETLSAIDASSLERFQKTLNESFQEAQEELSTLQTENRDLLAAYEALRTQGLKEASAEAVRTLPCPVECEVVKQVILESYSRGVFLSSILVEIAKAKENVLYSSEDFYPYSIVNDNFGDINRRHYGNNDVIGPSPRHGTKAAGIIAANRINDLGIRGIAENVKILAVRVKPEGDGRTKDIANGILYAVDRGARIISLSLGSDFKTYHEYYIDQAIRYAETNDVLVVHSAGNESRNIDLHMDYPNKYDDERMKDFDNWINVGSTFQKTDFDFVAFWSNYGKQNLDIFAPATATSLYEDNKYGYFDGTSVSAPIVAAGAALILSYRPKLRAQELRSLILRTARRHPGLMVDWWGEDSESEKILFEDLSSSEGVLDVYSAIKELLQVSE